MGACNSKENSYIALGDGEKKWTQFINKSHLVFPSVSRNDWYYAHYNSFCQYIRKNAPHTISNDIITIIFNYYDKRYTCFVSKNAGALSQSNKAKKSTIYLSNTIHSNYDGWLAAIGIGANQKSIKFILRPAIGNEEMIVYVQLSCYGLPFYAKKVKKFDSKTKNKLSIDICSVKKWLKWDEDKTMEFKANIQILASKGEYHQTVNARIWRVTEHVKYLWKIDEELLNMFKTAEDVNTSFYSQDFAEHGNWCLKCIPCTQQADCVLGLGIIGLPLDIHSIEVHADIRLDLGPGKRKKHVWGFFTSKCITFDHQYKWAYSDDGKRVTVIMRNSELYKLKTLSFWIEIRIESVFAYGDDGQKIAVPACKWNKYNIV